MKRIVTIIAISFSFLLFFQDRLIAQNEILYPTEVIEAAYFDVTPPLRDMMVIEPGIRTREWKNNVVKNHMGFMEDIKNIPQLNGPDPVLQMKDGEKSTRSIGVNINGVGNLSGVAPPDTDGDVGPNHYFQMVNLAFAIYDKSGTLLYGPVDNSTLWSGFIGSWTGTNDGDPIILYDSYSDRWMATQFAINTGDGTQWELVAISQTGDPTGSWYRYAFQFTYMPDYPKFGIWPDGYYLSINQFQKIGSSYYWKGGGACVLNRDKMIAGDPTAEMVFFNLGTSYGSLLPADADGTLPPPTGTPNYFTRFTSGKLQLWELGVDWANTSNSTITRKPDISIASFSNSGFTINQPGTSTSLDDLADRLMYRLQYRNFGTHQAMVTNHTVNNGSNKAAVRWYEMRKTGTSWSLYQQGTYNPNDGNHRWMGSIAMNASGDIALGYSVSGSSTYPSIRFTGRNNGDPLGTMTIAETSIFSGTHSQTGVSRWGDYSCMSVDPINDQTFWFTTEYSNGGWSWKTRIASFDISETVVPIISVTPGSFDETLKLGQSSNQQMTVKNSGEGTLNFSTQIDYLSTGTGWLSVAPSSGSLSTGQTQICTVTFNTSTLSIGSYSAEINVTSNDPMNPLITIPVSLTVYSTTPAIVVNPVSIDFGQVIPGNTIQSSYTVTNAGNETLEIFNTVSNNTVFSANPVYFSIDPSEQQIVNVSFFPSNVGVVSGALTIYSNDPTQPQVQVQLTGEGFLPTPQNLDANVQGFDVNLSWNAPPGIGRQMLGYNVYRNNNILNTTLVTELFYEDTDVDGGIYDYKVSAVYDEGESLKAGPVTVTVGSPHIAINPLSFAEGLFPDETSTQVLQIQNTGELDLSVDLQLEYVVEKIGEPVAIDPEIYSGQLNQRTNEFGHEINYTPLDPVDGYCIPSADCSYGDGFTDFEMSEINNAGSGCSPNGYGDFTNMTADLIAGQAYNVTFRSGYSRQYVCLWIDFDNNDTFDESERLLTDFYLPNKNQYYTAQIVIPSEIATGENRLRVRANWLNSSSDPCADFNYGETEDYTVNITGAQVQWLSLDPVAVSIPSGQTVDINVIMNTIDLEIGTYYASILIYSNDPDNPFIEVPVSLEVLNLLADFEADNTQIMAGESVNFTDLSHGTPTSWEWAFDGGEPTTSGDQNPAGVTYNTPGTFDVSLTVTNDNGTDTETKTSYITVSEPPIPVADFDAGSTTIFAGESIGFTDLTTNGPTSWSWQFPGAEPQTSLVQNPTAITYNSPGIYDVTLSVDNAYGSDTETKFDYITVEALPVPEADFTVSSTIVFAGESIDFYDLSTNNPTSWAWLFLGADWQTSYIQNPTGIIYSAPGSYDVTLTVVNAFGSDTETKTAYITVTVLPLPNADFEASSTTIYAGESIGFTDLTTNDPTSWSWQFPGAEPQTSLVQNPQDITYNSPGIFDVMLTATNIYGTDSEVKSGYITVNVLPVPDADFEAGITTVFVGEPIDFFDLSTNNPAVWAWLFLGADYQTSYIQNPAGITYSTPGTYDVSLTVSNGYGSDTEMKTGYITVNVLPLPVADFAADKTFVSPGEPINFTDLSTNNPMSWEWLFPGSETPVSPAQNPGGIIYNTPGTYDVSLSVDNAYGSDTETKFDYITVEVLPVSVADFEASSTTVFAGESIDFYDLSTNNPTSWAWLFMGADWQTSYIQNPTGIIYSAPGTYDVTLTVVNAFGSDTETKTAYITVTVLPLPNADFEASSTTIYAGESIGFTDLTTNGPTSWSWQFPGAEPQTALVQNPTAITYNSPGIYGVTLTATNIYGTDSEVKSGYITVNVLPVPVADFEVNFNSIEVGEPIDFTDLSTNSPTGWSWTFEGGTPTGSSDQNPLNIIYADEGAYDVQLTVTNQYGTDTKIKEDYIHVSYTPPVVADFTSDFTTIYQGEIIHFYDMSSGNPSFWIWNIDGASPTLTYQQNPVVIFNTPGIFNVKLTVSGINGSDVEIKEGYIEVIEILSIYPPGWNYEPTSSQHIIAIPVSANPRIFEVPVEPGDYLGVFYQEGNNQYRCGGAVAWDGSINVPIIAYGDEGFTPMKDGFTYGEEFIWKLYSFSQELEYTAIATYDPNQQNQGTFSPLGMSVTTDLFAGDQFELIIPQGWSGISSPVAPRDKDLGLLFAPISNNLELMYNYDGMFWPSSGVNTLIDWENKSGYNIKMAEESVFEFKGAGLTDISVQIQEGWNYIPVPVPCEVNVIPLFNSHLDDLIIVREISGFAVYWPEYNIKTLDHLVAGRAYMLMAQDGFNLEFSQCQGGLKTTMDIPVNNLDLTPCWDMIKATADVHTIAVTGTALDVLQKGDVIGAFSASGICYGAAEYNNNSIGLSIFGDDPFSSEIDGFEIDERIEFKLYRPGQHLIFELETQFDPVAPNQGLFTSNGLSVIKGFKYDPAGIDPQKTGPVSIFPNPTTGIITVAGIEHSDRVFLMSVDGQEIKYVENPGDSNIILDLGKHQKGIYMIKIESSKTTTMHKVILQ